MGRRRRVPAGRTPARRDRRRRAPGGRGRGDAVAVGHPHPATHLGNDEQADRRRLAAERLASLTDREREVAEAVGSGASTAEIAASLYMSEATVKAHVSSVLTKLAVANRVHIAILVHDARS
ncbi:MAG: helix-turn-helix transcriptional regulator [Acidimicrobiales bacterium]